MTKLDDLDPADVDRIVAEVTAQVSAQLKRGRAKKIQPTILELYDAWLPVVALASAGPNHRCHRKFLFLEVVLPGGDVFRLGDLPWDEATPPHMIAWQNALTIQKKAAGTAKESTKTLTHSYCDKVRFSVQAALTYHVKTRTIATSPMEGIPRLPDAENNARKGYYTDEQLEAYCRNLPHVAAAMLRTSAAAGGLRNAEVRGMLKANVNHQTRQVGVRNKGGKTKWVDLRSDIYELICAWSAVSPPECLYVFPNPRRTRRDKPIPESTWCYWMKKAYEATGIRLLGDEKPVVHHARHKFAQDNLRAGLSHLYVAKQMGCSVEVLEKRYGNPRGEFEQSEREKSEKPRAYPCPNCSRTFDDLDAVIACRDAHVAAGVATRTAAKSITPMLDRKKIWRSNR